MNTVKLTTDQLGKLLYKVEHESRRSAKRYAKDHGGTGRADELDALLAQAKSESAAIERARQLAAEAERHASEIAAEEARDELAHQCGVVRMAAKARWEAAIASIYTRHGGNPKSAMDSWWDACGQNEKVAETITAFGPQPTAEQIATGMESQEGSIDFDPSEPVEKIYNQICYAALSAEASAQAALAWDAVVAEAVPDGRYVVSTYYRKSMSSDGSTFCYAFADREYAEALLCLAGDFRSSSYNITLYDSEEVCGG